ncbi:Fungal zn2-cys6 binuclear cluster domain-containing [Teratosphaeria destructans]|uniref:Fungal zn2-cys6 binuclear cluster domain-containing n=1 Tax=Teratosphaeria destructans TaxID=418781 RepID=A0A9W7SJK8_9PEZI|nr:Fungal zn2-cys6 binuclear cluster domain-containing [Teratosphaeria destructans]
MTAQDAEEPDCLVWNSNDLCLSSGGSGPSPASGLSLSSAGSFFDLGLPEASKEGSTSTGPNLEDTLDDFAEQAMSLSKRALRARRQLDRRPDENAPIMVNSPVVNEAFEVANALLRFINCLSSQHSPTEQNDTLKAAASSSVLLALATYQHTLALFEAICTSIQKSLGFADASGDDAQHAVDDGNTAAHAQFVMVLQLIKHLLNRVGCGLRLRNSVVSLSPAINSDVTGTSLVQWDSDDAQGDSCSTSGLISNAYDVLKQIPREHLKLRQLSEGLQMHLETVSTAGLS